jgi:hypothetical protein
MKVKIRPTDLHTAIRLVDTLDKIIKRLSANFDNVTLLRMTPTLKAIKRDGVKLAGWTGMIHFTYETNLFFDPVNYFAQMGIYLNPSRTHRTTPDNGSTVTDVYEFAMAKADWPNLVLV